MTSLPSSSASPISSGAALADLKARVDAEIKRRKLWTPFPGPQTQALNSEADVLYYGGAAGGGKTDLLLGAAHTRHTDSIIFRREGTQLKGILDRARGLFTGKGNFNGTPPVTWRLADGRSIEFGAVQHEDDKEKYQGRPHDLICFDELPHFTESQFRFLTGWNRPSDRAPVGQRCRVIGAGNPPTTSEGEWVIRYWAPWLDKSHPNPAKPGELRWFLTDDEGNDYECEPGASATLKTGEVVRATSRTFIPARVSDNPVMVAANYASVLARFPEPLRSKMLNGDFGAGREDDPWQVIPTAWVELAMARWTPDGHGKRPMTALGVDVARGGRDRTVLAPRYDAWFDKLTLAPGAETPDGLSVVMLAAKLISEAPTPVPAPTVQVDVIGVGASVFDTGKAMDLTMVGLNGAEASAARDRSGKLGMVNCRAAWYWALREALDPDQGDNLALPSDRELLSDLVAPRWKLTARGIQVESKDDIKARIGRSPDKGDAVVYAHARPSGDGLGLLAVYAEMAAAAKAKNS
ncbi:terminase [Nitrospirillum amazonense]|uniref:terminase n=1 Tax=Nitrospirillum amazonense TaxID=28077 RepID=UPI002DD447F1|nr:terminase [Nitrospirillum amazonense]MEC4591622.1 terminase [Nitrospirillum amazonense]